MRRWIEWAATLYPRRWRARYGAEFQALLDDLPPDWREFTDLLRGAIIMQLTSSNVWRLIGVMGAAGAVLAFAGSFATPRRYVSNAAVRVERSLNGDLRRIRAETLSRSSLAEVIMRPSLDLYRRERARLPLEDVIDEMRRDMRFEAADSEVEISFAYPDRKKAQAAARALADRFVEQSMLSDRRRAIRWREIWPQDSPPVMKVSVVAPASWPVSAVGPNRLALAATGLGAGLLLGLAVAFRRTAAFMGCGLVLGAAVSYLVPAVYTSTAVMCFRPADVPERLAAAIEPVPARERLVRMREEILSQVDAKVRSRIAISPITSSAFTIAFSASDPETAQGRVRNLVTRFVEQNASEMRLAEKLAPLHEVRRAYENELGPHLAVLDPASAAERPVWPNRFAFAAGGTLLGFLTGIASRRRFSAAA